MTTVLDNIRRRLNHGTDQDREQYLAHPEPAIRALAIKRHTSPSVEQLVRASQDEDPCVREAVVDKKLPTIHFIEWLQREKNRRLFDRLLSNSYLPKHINPRTVLYALKDEKLNEADLMDAFNTFKSSYEESKEIEDYKHLNLILSKIMAHPACSDKIHRMMFELKDPFFDSAKGHCATIWEAMSESPNISAMTIVDILGMDYYFDDFEIFGSHPRLNLIANPYVSANVWDQVFLRVVPQHGHIKRLFEEGRLSFNGVWNGVECLRQHGYMIGFEAETVRGLFACLSKDDICKLFQQGKIDLDSYMFYDNQEDEDYTMGEYLMEYHPSEYELITASILESKLRTSYETTDVSLNTNRRPHL
ncbi:HEAT repeat domain-containing protein [Aeromonas hydrophila]|uniref:hypothetical protein n=1 Tax=Aeromonas hydrophila TaxID=644 RepID=UPI002B47B7EA|nr:hypothetical protein [Aeromonas hydrophila]